MKEFDFLWEFVSQMSVSCDFICFAIYYAEYCAVMILVSGYSGCEVQRTGILNDRA